MSTCWKGGGGVDFTFEPGDVGILGKREGAALLSALFNHRGNGRREKTNAKCHG